MTLTLGLCLILAVALTGSVLFVIGARKAERRYPWVVELARAPRKRVHSPNWQRREDATLAATPPAEPSAASRVGSLPFAFLAQTTPDIKAAAAPAATQNGPRPLTATRTVAPTMTPRTPPSAPTQGKATPVGQVSSPYVALAPVAGPPTQQPTACAAPYASPAVQHGRITFPNSEDAPVSFAVRTHAGD